MGSATISGVMCKFKKPKLAVMNLLNQAEVAAK